MVNKNTPSVEAFKWSNPVHVLAFGFGAGRLPVAPGTFGTVVGIPALLILSQLSLWLYLLVTLFLFVFGIWLCQQTARDLGVHDHPGIVWDEIVGYLVTMTAAPVGWVWIILGFGLFRFFDIVKPWPIRTVDTCIGGGLGIMLDDLLAGLYATFILHLCVKWIM
jgi:phosphatidylglycerophosphatase A